MQSSLFGTNYQQKCVFKGRFRVRFSQHKAQEQHTDLLIDLLTRRRMLELIYTPIYDYVRNGLFIPRDMPTTLLFVINP